MKLNITERLYLMNMAPTTWDMPLYRLRRAMLEKLSLSEDEEKAIEFKRGGEKYTENGKEVTIPQGEVRFLPLPIVIDFGFSDWEMEYFKKELKKMESEKKLNEITTELYLKFIENKEETEKNG